MSRLCIPELKDVLKTIEGILSRLVKDFVNTALTRWDQQEKEENF